MHSVLADFIRNTPRGREAEGILAKCVHCGFCNAGCPTYTLLGDERDSPRGRIYLIKRMLEGHPVTEKTRLHLDRCLTCLACEASCPSGVRYSRLLEIGRQVADERLTRPLREDVPRKFLRAVLPRPWVFSPAARVGRALRPVLPKSLAAKLPARRPSGGRPALRHPRRMLMLAGCVQPALAPNINAAAARVLDRIGISVIEAARAGCCGALRQHLDDPVGAFDDARRNIDAWWPYLEEGCEAILVTASGCSVQVKEYGHLLREDARYAEKAARISALSRDPSEVLLAEAARLGPLLAERQHPRGRVAFHSPCSLQHGLRVRGTVEQLLGEAGFTLVPVAEGHLCCGSAGTYSILQPSLSKALHARKLAALTAERPEQIATANIGCLTHLNAGSPVPVKHWIELIDEALH